MAILEGQKPPGIADLQTDRRTDVNYVVNARDFGHAFHFCVLFQNVVDISLSNLKKQSLKKEP